MYAIILESGDEVIFTGDLKALWDTFNFMSKAVAWREL